MHILLFLLTGLLALLMPMRALAAEPAPTPATAPATQTPVSATAPNKENASATGASAWQQSFASERIRRFNTGQASQIVILSAPHKIWRGELVLVPGAGNAVHHASPLLDLTERLAAAGWRCWLLAREENREEPTTLGVGSLPTEKELAALLALINAEPAPSDATPERSGKLPRFLIGQADAAMLAWNQAGAQTSEFTGLVLLGAGQLSEQAPKQPLLELQIPEQARGVDAAARSRQLRWQHLPQYQQQTLTTSKRLPITAWLGNAIDGWLRKTAAAGAGQDAEMKQQMTAPPTK